MTLKECMIFERKIKPDVAKIGTFAGKTIVVTGTLENFTRQEIEKKIESLGGFTKSSVSSKTDYVIAGNKPGSKLSAAKEKGIPVLSEEQFLSMIA